MAHTEVEAPRTAPGAPPPVARRRTRNVALSVAAVLVAVCAGGGLGGYLALHRTRTVAQMMGLSSVPVRVAPDFTLTDQAGKAVSLRGLRGRVVVLSFFDDRCIDLCPIISQEFEEAYRNLGTAGAKVAFVAVNVNAAHEQVRWVRSFTNEHGLDHIAHWYFLTGSTRRLEAVWNTYNVTVQVAPDGNVFHATPMYFLDASGRERAIADPTDVTLPNGTGYLPRGQLVAWGHGIATEARSLLPSGSAPGGS